MKTFIVLLRGVMPKGENKVPMSQLREVLLESGFKNVRTYIQSGNVLVDTELSASDVEKEIHVLIKRHIGANLPIVARTRTQINKVLDENPFQKGYDISRVFFALFAESPSSQKTKELLEKDFSPEELVITKDAAYMYIPGTYGRMKLSNNFLENKLGVAATTRNFNTLSKLIEMSQ